MAASTVAGALRRHSNAEVAERTQVEVAAVLGISKGRVSQLEIRALEKLKRGIQREATAAGVSMRDWLLGEG